MEAHIPRRFRATFSDLVVRSLDAVNFRSGCVELDFDGPLDYERLGRALRLCMDAEPILGCRFVPRLVSPYWERLSTRDLDQAGILKTHRADVGSCEYEENLFRSRHIDVESGPQVCALLIRHQGTDRLLLKISHMAADARGMQETACLLARLYRTLSEDPGFVPLPNLGKRTFGQVYRNLPRDCLLHFIRDYLTKGLDIGWIARTMVHPSRRDRSGVWSAVIKRFPASRVQQLKAYGNRNGVTLNDLFTAALLRAVALHSGWKRESLPRIGGTIDLRSPYLPDGKAEAVCNLSSVYFISLWKGTSTDFPATLANVKRQMARVKCNTRGLHFLFHLWLSGLFLPAGLKVAMWRAILNSGCKSKHRPLFLTNVGPIDERALNFGTPRVVQAEMIAGAIYPPFLLITLSGFSGTLTMSTGVFESATPRKGIEQLFELVDAELPRE